MAERPDLAEVESFNKSGLKHTDTTEKSGALEGKCAYEHLAIKKAGSLKKMINSMVLGVPLIAGLCNMTKLQLK